MANKTIAQLDTISGAIDNATDLAIMYDTSATKTVKTTIQNLLTTELSGLNTSGKNVVSAINEVYASISETISEIASEETSPASSNHNPGELILYDDGLYRTTSYIVIGESLTDTGESANIESITISECIKELYDVQTVLGNETLGTEATTVTGAIAEINNNIGSEEMGTDATTVTGAIAEHESDITSLNSSLSVQNISNQITIIEPSYVEEAKLYCFAGHVYYLMVRIKGNIPAGSWITLTRWNNSVGTLDSMPATASFGNGSNIAKNIYALVSPTELSVQLSQSMSSASDYARISAVWFH